VLDRETLLVNSSYQNRPSRAVGCNAVFGGSPYCSYRDCEIVIQDKSLEAVFLPLLFLDFVSNPIEATNQAMPFAWDRAVNSIRDFDSRLVPRFELKDVQKRTTWINTDHEG